MLKCGRVATRIPVEDLERFSVMVSEGYAWAGSTYRRGGYGVRMAARDTDDLRRIVWDAFGKPKRTLLHGQSWGGNVAAKAAELYAVSADGERNYDGVILTSGLLAGGILLLWVCWKMWRELRERAAEQPAWLRACDLLQAAIAARTILRNAFAILLPASNWISFARAVISATVSRMSVPR